MRTQREDEERGVRGRLMVKNATEDLKEQFLIFVWKL